MPDEPTRAGADRVSTGIEGMDTVLGGGLPAYQMHLLLGPPGAGKTTFAMQFLREGAANSERVLYVTLAESESELRQVAESHGWDLEGVTLRELAPSEDLLRQEQQYTILYPGEVEFSETMDMLLREVDEIRPTRVVFDSLAELRLLARDSVRYRHQILALKQFFAGRKCTLLLLDNSGIREQSLESVAHGVILLDQANPDYGRVRRHVRVAKLRGGTYRSGRHDFEIMTGGLTVYPRLVAAEHRNDDPSSIDTSPGELVSSGIPQLDQMLGGGLRRATSALLMGPAGAGKSTLAAQYAAAAAERGERTAFFVFEELRQTFIERTEGLGIPLKSAMTRDLVTVRQLDPAQLSPGEFIGAVRHAVEVDNVRLIVIDSLNGYLNAMAEERLVVVQLHELLTYLGQRDVLTLMTMAQHGLVGERQQSPLDVSYIADSVVLIRYFEAVGEIRQAISVVKKRIGPHERSIRELRLGPGVQVGEILREFEGVLSGSPHYVGTSSALLGQDVS